jgi:DNA-binding NtrC family response regulator
MRHILVVEHDRHVALTLLDGLQCLPDCEVAIATSGDNALRLFEQCAFDVLITDYKMPGTNGLALASRVQELYPQTAVLMITAHRDEVLSRKYASGLVRLILDKPVELERIRTAVLETLERSRVVAARRVLGPWVPGDQRMPEQLSDRGEEQREPGAGKEIA